MSNLLHDIIYLLLIPLLISALSNYYWREYTGGEIPEDAVVGGKDRIGPVYIGQVYVRPNSLLIAQINPGVKEVVVWTNRREVINKNIKILCGPAQNFVWFGSNGTDPKGKERVRGGHLHNKSVFIGRLNYDGNFIIGTVYKGLHWGDFDEYDQHTSIRISEEYEILVYVPPQIATCLTWEARKGYYWREYDGTIPVDAFPGGKDINRKNIFIGQAILNNGIGVVRIVPGVTEVENPMSAEKIHNFTKILCGNPTNFEWLSTTAYTLQVTLIDKNAVIGGNLNDGEYVWIGRISSGNEIKIGMVACCNAHTNLVLPKKYVNLGTSAYEVLTIK